MSKDGPFNLPAPDTISLLLQLPFGLGQDDDQSGPWTKNS